MEHIPKEKTPLDALTEFAKGLPAAEGMRESEIRLAAQIALNKHEDYGHDAQSAGSPDSALEATLKKALEARRGVQL